MCIGIMLLFTLLSLSNAISSTVHMHSFIHWFFSIVKTVPMFFFPFSSFLRDHGRQQQNFLFSCHYFSFSSASAAHVQAEKKF